MSVRKVSFLAAAIVALIVGFLASGSSGITCYDGQTCSQSAIPCGYDSASGKCWEVQVWADEISSANPCGVYEASDMQCAPSFTGAWNEQEESCDPCDDHGRYDFGGTATHNGSWCPPE